MMAIRPQRARVLVTRATRSSLGCETKGVDHLSRQNSRRSISTSRWQSYPFNAPTDVKVGSSREIQLIKQQSTTTRVLRCA
jgi:hypothetical protein